MLIGALASTPARALNEDEYAAMMGMLWRLQEPTCPSISFDPATFVKAMKMPGGNPSTVRSRHRVRARLRGLDGLAQPRHDAGTSGTRLDHSQVNAMVHGADVAPPPIYPEDPGRQH